MFTTVSLPDSSILLAKDCRLTDLRPNGEGLFTFEFEDLSEERAHTLLSGPEAALCRVFYRRWRDLRRRMDAIRYGGGERR